MYHQKKFYGLMPRNIGGLMEDVLHNGMHQLHEEMGHVWGVPVNIHETDNQYELHVIAPGLKKEDFKLSVDKNLLHISFEHKEEEQATTGKRLRTEYKFRSFKRSFTLSDKVDATHISAKYTDGVLYISIPKKEQTEVTTQEISVA